jgi:hypothetical protein
MRAALRFPIGREHGEMIAFSFGPRSLETLAGLGATDRASMSNRHEDLDDLPAGPERRRSRRVTRDAAAGVN